MSTPFLDEDGIITLLRAVVSPDTTDAIQAGAAQALLDLYDRKVTREEFCEQGSKCLALYGQTAKLWMLNNIHNVFQSDSGLTEEKFKIAQDGLADLIRKQCETLVETVKRLQLCPTDDDKVH